MPHDIRDLRLEPLADGQNIVVCKCGWRSQSFAKAADALGDWQRRHAPPTGAPEHRFVAIVQAGEALVELHCACGWAVRGTHADCLDYLSAHVDAANEPD